jgi:hypothetical protein
MTFDDAIAIAQEIRKDYPTLHVLTIAREFIDSDDWHLIISDARLTDDYPEQDRRKKWIGSREEWEGESRYYRPPFTSQEPK